MDENINQKVIDDNNNESKDYFNGDIINIHENDNETILEQKE